MRVTLIKPNIGRRTKSDKRDNAAMEPLQLGVLAALTPEDIDVVMYDDRLEDIPYDEPTDLVAITVETFTAKRSYEISREYKKRGIPVIMGGIHVKLLPEEVSQYCDSIAIGDAEGLWRDVIADLKKGRLKKKYTAGFKDIPQEGIITRRDIYKGKKYLPVSLMQYSRGCYNRCEFCASSVYFESKQRCRRVDEVIEEIKSQNRKDVFFVDDNIVADKEKAKELFRALKPLKIRWVSQGSLDMLSDRELMRLMVDSGCLGLVVGFESINDKSLREMNKGINQEYRDEEYKKAIEELRQWGLQTWAAFTVGYDNDTLESIRKTYEFALKSKFTFAAYNILMPYPGTRLFDKMKDEKRLLYDGCWWLHDDYRFNYASFLPKNMTSDELTAAALECRNLFNSPKSILYRVFEPRTNFRNPLRFLYYWVYNPLFRREVFEKQGMPFGYREDGVD